MKNSYSSRTISSLVFWEMLWECLLFVKAECVCVLREPPAKSSCVRDLFGPISKIGLEQKNFFCCTNLEVSKHDCGIDVLKEIYYFRGAISNQNGSHFYFGTIWGKGWVIDQAINFKTSKGVIFFKDFIWWDHFVCNDLVKVGNAEWCNKFLKFKSTEYKCLSRFYDWL